MTNKRPYQDLTPVPLSPDRMSHRGRSRIDESFRILTITVGIMVLSLGYVAPL